MANTSRNSSKGGPASEWMAGLAIGVATCFLLALVTLCVPAIEDLGVDAGHRLVTWAKQIGDRPIAPHDGIPRFIFLDADPGGRGQAPNNPSTAACNSMATCEPARNACVPCYFTDSTLSCPRSRRDVPPSCPKSPEPQKTLCPLSDVVESKKSVNLACQPNRALNRYLISEMLRRLYEISEESKTGNHSIRAIVLDVMLDGDDDPKMSAEDKRLSEIMRHEAWIRKKIQFIIAGDSMLLSRSGDPLIQVLTDQRQRYGALFGVPYPIPDSAVRRYHRCFQDISTGGSIESLPYLIARTVRPELPKCGTSNEQSGIALNESPRIRYTIPSFDAHADSSGLNDESKKLQYQYSLLYLRCLATNLWDVNSLCSHAQTYENAVVVIGASNPSRRDRHFTPLGDMSGPEIIINSTISFLSKDALAKPNSLYKLAAKLLITVICSFIWLGYFYAMHKSERSAKHHGGRTIWAQIRHRFFVAAAFMLTVVAVALIAFGLMAFAHTYLLPGYSVLDLNILIPVLAIALELYAENSLKLVDAVKSMQSKFKRSSQ